jgi:hypothetical protein
VVRGNWRDVANWRQLKKGMKMDQVKDLLGEPDKVMASATLTLWYWGWGEGVSADMSPTVHRTS